MYRKYYFRLLFDFSTFAEGQRFLPIQHYEALPEEPEVNPTQPSVSGYSDS